MEAFKNLIKNLALFLLVGAAPSLCWAGGLFSAISWPSFFLLAMGIFCALWLKTRSSLSTLKQLLLAREEEWALCEGDQIIEKSSYFPGDTLQSFRTFVHAHSLPQVEECLGKLLKEHFPFQTHLRAHANNASYSLTGAAIDGKTALFLKNITENVGQERVRTENQRKNEELIKKLQTTLEILPIFVWHRDEHQRITYCNIKYASAVQAVPTKIYEEDIELIQPRAAKSLARKALNMQISQHVDSTAIVGGERLHLRLFEVPDICGKGTLGIAYDITELQEARTDIKELIAAHGVVLDHLTTAIAAYDADGILHYYNQAYVALHGFNEEFLKAKPRLDEVLEDQRNRRQIPEYSDFPAHKKRWMAQLREQTVPQEDLMHLPDERTLRIFSAPYPHGGLLFIFEDITDTLALERTNKTLLDAYQTTLDHLFEGVIIVGSDNRLKSFNPSYMSLWKLKPQDIEIGEHLADILERLKKFFDYGTEGWDFYKANVIANMTDRLPKTGQFTRKDGMIINFCYVPLPNGDHLISYMDVSDPSRIQQALEEKKAVVDQISHLQSVFTSSVSDELKPPLALINTCAESLSAGASETLNERQIEYVGGILDASTTLLTLVDDILDTVSLETGNLSFSPSLVSIPSLLKEVVKHVSQQKGPSLVEKHSKDVKEWVVDEKRLKQALLILVERALEGVSLERHLKLAAHLHQDALEIALLDVNTTLELQDLFVKGAGKKGGGVREALAEKLIALHGGRFSLSSKPEGDVLMRCVLPQTSFGNVNTPPRKRKV